MAETWAPIRGKLLACCTNKEKPTQFKLATCTTCDNCWHVECASKDFQHGGRITDDMKPRLKSGYRTKNDDPVWDWRCPRCCLLKVTFLREMEMEKLDKRSEAQKAAYFWTCPREGCTQTGNSGPGGLKTHLARDHDGVVHKCPACNTSCSTPGALKRHRENSCKPEKAMRATVVTPTPILALPMPKP